jgi:two-component system KDP operon response regulator KdpE
VTKPFVMGELLARLRAKLRRQQGDVMPRSPSNNTVIGRWQVDLAACRVTRADVAPGSADLGATPRLTPIEWAILEPLLRRPGQLVGPAELAARVWGGGVRQGANCLRFHLVQLRRKLEDDPARPRHLLTERGMGYRYQP